MFFFLYEQAEDLINFLRKNGIPAADWPTLHPSILGNPDYDFENYLYKRSVALPVHQDLNQKDLDFIINKIKEFDKLIEKNCFRIKVRIKIIKYVLLAYGWLDIKFKYNRHN